MKIQYASDLHLEFKENAGYIKHNPLEVVGDILILAGDIGYLGDQNYSWHPFWDWASENFEQVIVAMGNHEFYKFFDISTLGDGYKLQIRHNVAAYYNAVIPIGDTDIIVSTLWSAILLKDAAYTEQVISDFRRIMFKGELLTFADFNREHRRCLDFIKSAVSQSNATHKIVVTHHVPSFRMLCPKFKDSNANGAFTVELEDYIQSSGIGYWIYGHSHYNVDVRIGRTLCISNQLGYVFHNEHTSFRKDATIEL
ncbi:MAG: metallophosphoesterase [Muribaculaceae bacterium]|nr:metallophosphoesterase [Muribaculaceae bacterium]MDE7190792.1 metallophosphoesterase [Muribaculaceae bacterium]